MDAHTLNLAIAGMLGTIREKKNWTALVLMMPCRRGLQNLLWAFILNWGQEETEGASAALVVVILSWTLVLEEGQTMSKWSTGAELQRMRKVFTLYVQE
jgi:hypothetical protein